MWCEVWFEHTYLFLLLLLPQIIDLMVLVVDAGKGIQAQTAECIVIGEVAVGPQDMVVALNKTGGWGQGRGRGRDRQCRGRAGRGRKGWIGQGRAAGQDMVVALNTLGGVGWQAGLQGTVIDQHGRWGLHQT